MASQKFLEPWHRLDGKVVMVTGASSGLGREICLDLAKAGCKIVAAARRIDRLKSLCDEINGSSSSSSSLSSSEPNTIRAVAVELDVSAKGAVIEPCVKKAWDAFGRIDVLVNNAGVRGNVNSSLDLSEEEWDEILKTNLTGSWLVSKYVCILMRNAKQKGSVVNISSIAGLNRGQLPGGVIYASSKAAVNTMTKTHITRMTGPQYREFLGRKKDELTAREENFRLREYIWNIKARVDELEETIKFHRDIVCPACYCHIIPNATTSTSGI